MAGRPVSNRAKCALISEIVGFGLDVGIEIIAEYDDELDALDHEFRLVDLDPTLTNVAPGGIGKVIPLSVQKRLRERRVAKILAARAAAEAAKRFRSKESRFLLSRGLPAQFAAVARNGEQARQVSDWVAELEGRRDRPRTPRQRVKRPALPKPPPEVKPGAGRNRRKRRRGRKTVSFPA